MTDDFSVTGRGVTVTPRDESRRESASVNDSVLRDHPQYRELFKALEPVIKPEVEWLPHHQGLVNSKCGRYQVRKAGNPPVYSLFNIRITPFARLMRDGFKSFDEVKEFLRK